MKPTIASRLIDTAGRPAGFDYLRLILACSIVCWHSVITSYGVAAQTTIGNGLIQPFVAILLPMFFALSGFLVAGSLERTNTVALFLAFRAIRIYPALAVESLICALILGPLLTTLPLDDYVTAWRFKTYFLNILGLPHFYLPGVFETTPFNKVNGQLWTVPFELKCYVILAALALFGVVRRRGLLVLVALAFAAWSLFSEATGDPASFAQPMGVVPGWLLVVAFLVGVAVYLYRDVTPWSARLGWISLVFGIALMAVPYGRNIAVPILSYATICLGLLNPQKSGFLKHADLSYGIFLYSFPIQQTVMLLAPWARHWWINVAIALPLSTLVAAISWRFIEKPALGLRKPLQRWESACLEVGWARWVLGPAALGRKAST